MDRLPLGSVRTFAVVAGLLTSREPAEELNVTPSAVSHQVRVLEEYLSTQLFRREKNQFALTELCSNGVDDFRPGAQLQRRGVDLPDELAH